MKTHNLLKKIAIIIPMFSIILSSAPAHAIEIKDAAVEIRDDFVLEPAKEEVILKPGEKATRTLSIVNRTDSEQTFNVDIEDFTGSKDPKQVILLLGQDKGPYSLRDFIKPEVKTFKLQSKQRANLAINISIPSDAQPGGRYASVLVSTTSEGSVASGENKAKTVSRVGALYFVKIPGPVNESGKLSDFRLSGPEKTVYEKGPFDFEILFENNGNMYLTPGGSVEIKNMFGQSVDNLAVAPFFSMPGSIRSTQVSWDSKMAFGKYSAIVSLERGYRENISSTDSMTITFWVLPWKVIVILLVVILIVAYILRKFIRKFEIRKK